MFSDIREFEVKLAVKEIYNKSNKLNGVVKMEMKEWFANLIMNIMVKILFGVQYIDNDNKERSKAHKAIRRFVEKALKETAKEIDCLGEEWLVEHKRKRKLRVNKSGDEEDFMDVMLSICEDKDLPGGFDADTIIKATCMALLVGGTDTTIVTLTWTLSLLLNNYKALKKAQDELDTHVGKNRWPERFLTTHKDVNVRGNHFELIPFGSGRRMCPGVSLGLQVVLLQGFNFKKPLDEPIDMSESFGVTILKASPLEVQLTPRLDSNLYK
ncbi:hypothetical protein P3L10_012267 [Capsicum annuum]